MCLVFGSNYFKSLKNKFPEIFLSGKIEQVYV